MKVARNFWDWLKSNSDQLSALGAILGILLFGITIWQLNETRKVLKAQTIGASLSEGRVLMSDLADDPKLAEQIYGIPEDIVSEAIFIQKAINLFSQQYLYFSSGMISEEHWSKINRDMCEFSQVKNVEPIVKSLLSRDVYPADFTTAVSQCFDGAE